MKRWALGSADAAANSRCKRYAARDQESGESGESGQRGSSQEVKSNQENQKSEKEQIPVPYLVTCCERNRWGNLVFPNSGWPSAELDTLHATPPPIAKRFTRMEKVSSMTGIDMRLATTIWMHLYAFEPSDGS